MCLGDSSRSGSSMFFFLFSVFFLPKDFFGLALSGLSVKGRLSAEPPVVSCRPVFRQWASAYSPSLTLGTVPICLKRRTTTSRSDWWTHRLLSPAQHNDLPVRARSSLVFFLPIFLTRANVLLEYIRRGRSVATGPPSFKYQIIIDFWCSFIYLYELNIQLWCIYRVLLGFHELTLVIYGISTMLFCCATFPCNRILHLYRYYLAGFLKV